MRLDGKIAATSIKEQLKKEFASLSKRACLAIVHYDDPASASYLKGRLKIAEELGATEFIIYRDLTKRLSMMVKIAPQLVTVEMVENVKNVLRQHSLDNSLMMNKK